MEMLMFGALSFMLLIVVAIIMLFVHEYGHVVNELMIGAEEVKVVVRPIRGSGDTTVTKGTTCKKPQSQIKSLSGGLIAELRFIVLCFGAAGFFSSFNPRQWVVIQIVVQLGIWLFRRFIVAVLFETAGIATAVMAITALAILAVMFGTAMSPDFTRLVVAWREQTLGSLGFLSPISQLCLLAGGIAGIILWLRAALGGLEDGRRIRKLQDHPNKPAPRRRRVPAKRTAQVRRPAYRRQPTARRYINQR